ncbi:MAG: tetratricopeptide repeat protein [Acidobacteria bacterium]|nr:tetratricopeptide repeat protein [Acidobacteriota bacterium]
MRALRLRYFLLLAAIFAVAIPASAKDKWLNLQTKNFNIVSNADEDNTRELALKLEQFRAVFAKIFKLPMTSAIPVTVVVFKNDDSYKPFKPLYNGKPANVAGYFQRDEDENLITLDLSAKSEEHPFALIFHEYTHLLTSTTPRRWPVWLSEGIAEVYSTFEVNKNKAILGSVIANHVYYLREKRFVPLKDLFQVGHDSPIYNERDKQGVFYAQSWALAHYLMFGDKLVRQPMLSQYIKLIHAGTSPEEAFTQAFKTDYATMEKNLREYIGRNAYTQVTITLDSTEGEKEMTVRPLSEAESQYYLGKILLHTQRLDESEAFFKRSLALDATLPQAHEGLGFVAMRRDNFAEAETHFKEAVAHDSKNFMAHYYYAEVLKRQAEARSGRLDAATTKTIADELKTTIQLMPTFAHAYSLLGFIRLVSGEQLEEGAQALRKAIQLEPQNTDFRINLASLQMRMRDFDGAKKTLESLLNSEAKASAQAMLNSLEGYKQALSSANSLVVVEEVNHDSDAEKEKDTPTLKRQERGEDERPRTNSPTGAPVRLEGTQQLSGVITAVECKGNAMTIALKTADQVARFYIPNHNLVPFFSRASTYSVDIVCGPNKLQAIIYFKPQTAKAPFAGEVVAVEFKQ